MKRSQPNSTDSGGDPKSARMSTRLTNQSTVPLYSTKTQKGNIYDQDERQGSSFEQAYSQLHNNQNMAQTQLTVNQLKSNIDQSMKTKYHTGSKQPSSPRKVAPKTTKKGPDSV